MTVRRTAVAPESVVEFATREIRRRIRAGELAPGQRLVASELGRALGVSLGPLREALTALAGEGLVEMQAHRGAVVKQRSVEEMEEIYALREVVEGLAARLAARAVALRGQPAEALLAAAEQCRDTAARFNFPDFQQASLEFHQQIYELSGVGFVSRLARQLSEQIIFAGQARLAVPEALREAVQLQDRVAAAIAEGDEGSAEEAMRVHLLVTRQYAMGR